MKRPVMVTSEQASGQKVEFRVLDANHSPASFRSIRPVETPMPGRQACFFHSCKARLETRLSACIVSSRKGSGDHAGLFKPSDKSGKIEFIRVASE